jgi:hypothetical protein
MQKNSEILREKKSTLAFHLKRDKALLPKKEEEKGKESEKARKKKD